MVVNFKIRKISRDMFKLIRISTLIKKNREDVNLQEPSVLFFLAMQNMIFRQYHDQLFGSLIYRPNQ